jgi:hypothetical protein
MDFDNKCDNKKIKQPKPQSISSGTAANPNTRSDEPNEEE